MNLLIIQARMGSTRLPGKVLKKINHQSILENLMERIKPSKLIDEYVSKQFDSYLEKIPGDRKGAALFAAGSLEGLLLSVMDELPYNVYNDLTEKLKG